MKFRCERDTLHDALSSVARAVQSRGTALPVLSGILTELSGDTLSLTGTDLDLTIRTDVEVTGDTDGRTVLPARLATDIVRSLEPGAVEITAGDDAARISSGRSDFSVRIQPVEDFPQPSAPEADAVQLDAEVLEHGLRQVVPAASTDDARPVLTGVLLVAKEGGLQLVATDSYRLSMRDLPGVGALDEGQRVLVPRKALAELLRLLGEGSVDLVLGERDVAFTVGATTITTRLIEGDYPNVWGLVPSDYPNQLRVAREPLLDAVRRVRLLARESVPLRLTQRSDALELTAVTTDVGEASEGLDADFAGEELTVAFNPEYLIDGLEVITAEEVVLETRDALKPAVLKDPARDDFLYLLMPVRV